MNKKKALEKRIYKKGLMNVEERDTLRKEQALERYAKKVKQNKKLLPPQNS